LSVLEGAMTILIRSTLRKQRVAASAIRARLDRLLAALSMDQAEVSVLLVGDRRMRELNRRYRRKDQTTDVLSFAFLEGPSFGAVQRHMLGDIVISIPTAARQAKAADETLQQSVDRLLVHGLLHLLGYDHEKGAQGARSMQRAEKRLLGVLRS
jgi:probable rRNA maturation factor